MMENFEDAFQDEKETVAKVATEGNTKPSASSFKQTYARFLASHPDVEAKRGSLSSSLEVVNSLGFGPDNGNIIVDEELTKTSGKRKVKGVTKIVGYTVKNVSKAPINLVTEKYAQDGNGVYVGTTTIVTVAPNETIDLARKYVGLNAVRPEFGEVFSNGIVVFRTKSQITDLELNKLLNSTSFRFDPKLNLKINDDSIKIQIGEKVDDKWVVTKDYVETFGFLMNEEVKTSSSSKGKDKSKGKGVSDIEAKAYEIYNLMRQNGEA